MSATAKLRVTKIDVLQAKARDTDEIMTLLRMKLENNWYFLMSNIPEEIALEIYQVIHDLPIEDARHRVSTLVNEIAIVNEVIIDTVVPMTSAFQATIKLTVEGVNRELVYQMVPSHAVLLAVRANAPIYVSKDLAEQYALDSPLP